MRRKRLMMAWLGLLVSLFAKSVKADTVFIEAETMQPSSSGWVATNNDQTGRASRTKTLWGADGAADAVASKTVRLSEAGLYRVWVRYMQVGAWRGPFQLAVSAGEKLLGVKTFDLEVQPGVADWEYTWQSFDADLPAGEVTLSLTKHEQKNCVGYVRHVDCVLLTSDQKLVPDHLPFGPQTLVRVTMGEGYDRPVYLHLFADHYRSPWYAHYAMGRDGIRAELAPPAEQMLKSGDVTPWCNLTPTVYQDSGAALNLSVRHSYHEKAARFRAKLEFGRAIGDRLAETGGRGSRRADAVADIKSEKRLGRSLALPNDDVEVIKTFDVEASPNGLVIIAPPDLESPQNIARLKRDRDFAEEIGKLADAFEWPKHGRKPVKIPFLVSANIGGYELPVDAAVTAREQKTLDYFGFNGAHERILHGAWHMKNDSYCSPDLAVMRERVKHDVELFQKSGRRMEDIAACMLMDEPTGQAASFMAKDEAYRERFREWLKAKSLKPEDLLVSSWDAVRPVAESERDQFPALHYFTQLFRTRAIGDFMATQRRIIEEAYGVASSSSGEPEGVSPRTKSLGSPVRGLTPSGSPNDKGRRSLPFLVNFSDGAVYHANFCGQGIDYFELLDADDQNAIWGEDWANNSSTFECGAFNVALMQSAARKRGQTIGHYLIAHAGRTPWDIKTKAVSETARGVRLWMNFAYGPNWSSHEGGPTWRSHLWHHRPELWTANAEISREIGAVEDWLVTAKPAPAQAAILYSSSSDIWTMPGNVAFGHDRMHTWLALTHSQTPVDIVSEREIERLDQYKVCYLSGPNLTRAAAARLRTWVESGGTLFLSAGAASRDEFNRPLDTLQSLLPVERGELTTPEPYNNSGKFLSYLTSRDTVTWGDQQLEVLSVKQSLKVVEYVSNVLESKAALTPKGNGHVENVPHVLATFKDGQPAVVIGRAGKGQILVCGFLPALSYIKPALMARRPLEQKLDSHHAAAKLKATDNNDQPEATNATASTASKAASIAGISPADRELLDRSHNPWVYSTGIRDRLLTPIRSAKLTPSLSCDMPLIDAVELRCEQGVLLALSNHTLKPLDRIELRLKTDKPVTRAESVRLGPIPFERLDDGSIRIALALAATDFVTVSTQADVPSKGLKLGKLRVGKILFLGNSITLHGPAPQIGWTGNWGMAASAEDKDYVHLLTSQIAKAAGGKPEVKVKNIADFERHLTDYKLADELKEELAFEADVVIIALGENASSPKTDEAKAQFETAFANLFAELKKHGQPRLFVRSQFWQDADKDRLMQKTCKTAGGTFLDISKLGFEETNYARAERKIEHAGVAGHPGDKGMKALADVVWNAIKRHAVAE